MRNEEIDKEYVTYDIAIQMRQLGFDEVCFGRFMGDGTLMLGGYETNSDLVRMENIKGQSDGLAVAPLYQQVFNWFRKECGLEGTIQRTMENKVYTKFYMYSIVGSDPHLPVSLGFDLKDDASYEEAEKACIMKLIEIHKNK